MIGAPTYAVGVVDSLVPGRAAVRVRFPDMQDGDGNPVVSEPIAVLQPFGGDTGPRTFFLPSVGQQVGVLFESEAGPGGASAGFILGAIYADADPLPVDVPEAAAVVFPDGTRVEYHPERGVTIDAAGDVTVKSAGN